MNEDLIGVLSLLPPWLTPWVLLVLQVMPIVALVLAVVKQKMGTPNPARDSWGRTFAFWALWALDWLALNSTPISEKLKQAEQARARRSLVPGGGR